MNDFDWLEKQRKEIGDCYDGAPPKPGPIIRLEPGKAQQALASKKKKPPVFRGVLARFPNAIEEIARVSEFGAQKYGVPLENVDFLTSGVGVGGYLDAEGRHNMDHVRKGPRNPDDGNVLHLAQAAWNSLAALETYLVSNVGVKDPPAPPSEA